MSQGLTTRETLLAGLRIWADAGFRAGINGAKLSPLRTRSYRTAKICRAQLQTLLPVESMDDRRLEVNAKAFSQRGNATHSARSEKLSRFVQCSVP